MYVYDNFLFLAKNMFIYLQTSNKQINNLFNLPFIT